MKKIAIFASGNGSNAENITKYFAGHPKIKVSCFFVNRPDAFVIERAKKLNIPVVIFKREQFYNSDFVLKKLNEYDIDLIVLAGFLWLIPKNLIDAYPQKIINIHPALLPKFGGKGMYGDNVHRAVLEAGEKQSGISIHYVNEHYDQGDIIFQTTTPVFPDDTIETLAKRIHQLEYEHYPKIIELLLND